MNTFPPTLLPQKAMMANSNNIPSLLTTILASPSTRTSNMGVIGHNGSGKRTLLRAVADISKTHGRTVQVVDFDTHCQLSQTSETVARVLGGLKESTDLVVRFGLTHVWWRLANTLSTGEMRRVMLAKAISRNPDVLILDRPFDGLDIQGRAILMTLLEELCLERTKLVKPLVQGIQWKERRHPQLFISTHRYEQELPSAIKTLLLCASGQVDVVSRGNDHHAGLVDLQPVKSTTVTPTRVAGLGKDATALTNQLVKFWWGHRRSGHENDTPATPNDNDAVLDVFNVTMFPTRATTPSDHRLTGQDISKPLLDRASWTVRPREVWWVEGPNGASKSILLSCALGPDSLLELASLQHRTRTWDLVVDPEQDRRRKRPPKISATKSVSIVSTELHVALMESNDDPLVVTMLSGMPESQPDDLYHLNALFDIHPTLEKMTFKQLSLGQQKLVLIARALCFRPRLLILDEAMQSLDLTHRRKVSHVIDSLCTSSMFDTAVIIVTHHMDELPRVVSHRLSLMQGKIVSRGPWSPMVSGGTINKNTT